MCNCDIFFSVTQFHGGGELTLVNRLTIPIASFQLNKTSGEKRFILSYYIFNWSLNDNEEKIDDLCSKLM